MPARQGGGRFLLHHSPGTLILYVCHVLHILWHSASVEHAVIIFFADKCRRSGHVHIPAVVTMQRAALLASPAVPQLLFCHHASLRTSMPRITTICPVDSALMQQATPESVHMGVVASHDTHRPQTVRVEGSNPRPPCRRFHPAIANATRKRTWRTGTPTSGTSALQAPTRHSRTPKFPWSAFSATRASTSKRCASCPFTTAPPAVSRIGTQVHTTVW